MDKDTDKKKGRGRSAQDSDPTRSNSGEPKATKLVGGLTHAEVLAKGKELFQVRLERVKAKLPPRGIKLIDGIPPKLVGIHLKALLKESSPKGAIKAKCHDCVAWEDVKKNVGQCGAVTCPLWAWRPYQDKKG